MAYRRRELAGRGPPWRPPRHASELINRVLGRPADFAFDPAAGFFEQGMNRRRP